MSILNARTIRRSAVALAFAGAVAVGGAGSASAQSDYPLEPEVPTTDAPSNPVVSPDGPTSQTEGDEPDAGATLPQTGGPGTSQILLIAGAAVAAGVVVTGAASRRRDDGLNVA